ncbi:hypothetical protein [Massilia cavernae]|uniref:hypothetical protein n=1 Tax=Massilia cavernae TaxID=2320864 RepID=UPI0011C3C207|nr:hypothetical protein [Massilia cavernae]
MNKNLRASTVIAMALCLSACDSVQPGPKIIDADGDSYLACSGLVWVDKTSGTFSSDTVFKVSFTDSGNMKHTLWGIKKVSCRDPPGHELCPTTALVYIPDPKVCRMLDGKPFVNGIFYSWPDGSKAGTGLATNGNQ